MPATRDPVSERFDAAVRPLLARAYASPGTWVSSRVKDPTGTQASALAADGIDVWARDPERGARARTRWCRGFVRAAYYQHRWWWNGRGGAGTGWRRDKRLVKNSRSLEVDIGPWRPALGVIPAGHVVKVQLHRGGRAAALAAKNRMPTARRIYDGAGNVNGAATDVRGRDWA